MNKIHIDNRTELSLITIADILETWEAGSFGETNYVGKHYGVIFTSVNKRYQMDITIQKTCLSVVVIAV